MASTPAYWQSTGSGFGGAGNSLTYANGYWVGGGDGKIYTATSLTGPWTSNTSAAAILGANQAYFVAYGGGLWVAGGAAGSLLTATDPTGTWTANTASGFSTASYIFDADYDGTNWVLASQSGATRYTTDPAGTTWSDTGATGAKYVNQVRYLNGYWIMVGYTAALTAFVRYATAASGTWNTPSGANGVSGFDAYSVAYGNGKYVIVGSIAGTRVYTADTPSTWTANSGNGTTNANVRGLAYGNGTWVLGNGSSGLYWTTNPAGAWTAAVTSSTGSSLVRCVAYGAGGWGATNDGSNVVYTNDRLARRTSSLAAVNRSLSF